MTDHWLWPAFVDAVHRNEATIALPPGVYLAVGIVPVSDAPATGDHVYAERHPDGDTWQAWRAQPGGQPSPIPNVTRVDDADTHFILHGDRKPAGSIYGQPQPWQVRCRKDGESTDTMLRGVVE